MNVSEALDSRMSCRAFLDRAVSEATIRSIIELARRAAFRGQPAAVVRRCRDR